MTTRVFRGITYTVKTATSINQILNGTPGPDWIEALGGNNRITTGAGNDVVLAGVSFGSQDGFTIVDYYPPFDGAAIFWTPLFNAGSNIINTGDGDDYVATGNGSDLVYLGNGNDVYDGASGNDTIYAEAGNDKIFFLFAAGNKTIDAGAGNDRIEIIDVESFNPVTGELLYSPTPGNQHLINAGSGDDDILIDAIGDEVTINAGSGNNRIGVFNIFRAVVNAEAGDDRITVAGGNSRIYGGEGNNIILAGRILEFIGIEEIFGEPIQRIYAANSEFYGIESGNHTVYVGAGNDYVLGGFGSDTVYLGNGDNFFDGIGGGFSASDTVYAGSGNDTILADSGSFYLGDGNNRIDAFNASKIYTGSGNDWVIANGWYSTIYAGDGKNRIETAGFSEIHTGSGDDLILGEGGNLIYAGEGRNTITLGSGSNTIYAGAGNDTITTGAGNDIVYAGQGNNRLDLGTGNDIVYSGSGADIFILNGGAGSVEIRGFGSNDKISLGAGLSGAPLTFTKSNGDTLVKQGGDLLATLKWVQVNSVAIA